MYFMNIVKVRMKTFRALFFIVYNLTLLLAYILGVLIGMNHSFNNFLESSAFHSCLLTDLCAIKFKHANL